MNLVMRIGTPARASMVKTTLPRSSEVVRWARHGLSVSITWSTPTPSVIRELVVRYPKTTRWPSSAVFLLFNTRSPKPRERRGSPPLPLRGSSSALAS